ncbi:hypothetical protein NKH77_50455 [Streptomyces sp. M19]
MPTGGWLTAGANRLRWEAAAVWRTARIAVRQSGPERDTMVQSLKAAGAAIAAWALTGWWLNAPLALLARGRRWPWSRRPSTAPCGPGRSNSR